MVKKIYPYILAAILALGSAQVEARCKVDDLWTGPDKTKHLLGGAAIGSTGTLIFKNPHYGFAAGVAVGGLKELIDRRGYGTCSLQDFAVTVGGAAAGAYGTSWIITPRFIGYRITLK